MHSFIDDDGLFESSRYLNSITRKNIQSGAIYLLMYNGGPCFPALSMVLTKEFEVQCVYLQPRFTIKPDLLSANTRTGKMLAELKPNKIGF